MRPVCQLLTMEPKPRQDVADRIDEAVDEETIDMAGHAPAKRVR